ncbi:MAG: hypothetical protein ACRBB2_00275 [Nitrosopumilus sp.]
MEISKIKQQLVDELLHYGNQVLYFQNNEITTGLIDNKIEIKIHLSTGQLLYFDNEVGYFVNLLHYNISENLISIAEKRV